MRLSDLNNNDLFIFVKFIKEARKKAGRLVLHRKVSMYTNDDTVIHAYTSFDNDGIILCENPPETEVLQIIT